MFRQSMLPMLAAFVLTFAALALRLPFLPRDHGKKFAVNGDLSKGKLRGVGLIFMVVYCIVCLVFVRFSTELLLYLILLMASCLSGYLDDAAKNAWNEYLKGAIDLVLSVGVSAVYIAYNGTGMHFFGYELQLPWIVYLILGTVLVWASINVTNCSDGVDGLCGSLCVVSLLSVLPMLVSDDALQMAVIMIAVLGAYLYFNCSPSSMLMGDAGSRPLGVLLAILFMRSGHPCAYIGLCAVLIVDGGLGLLKVTLIRFLKMKVMTNLRTPIHDHLRKNLEWSDTQTVARLVVVQAFVSCVTYAVMGMAG